MRDIVFFDNLAALEKQAEFLGINELLIARPFRSREELQKLKAAAGHKGILRFCLLLEKPDSALLKKMGNSVDFVAALGGTPKANRFAVSTRGIDFLIMPAGIERNAFDIALARVAAENNVEVAASFSEFLRADSRERARLMKEYSMVARLCAKRKAKFSIFSCARNEFEMRSPKELEAFAALLQRK
jgi:RNase P/RNase MRP subunit p30